MSRFVVLLVCLHTLPNLGFSQEWLIARGNVGQRPFFFDYTVGGTASNERRIDEIDFLAGMDFSSEGVLYALSAGNHSLYTVDPDTSDVLLVGRPGGSITEGDLSFDPVSGQLYSLTKRQIHSLDAISGNILDTIDVVSDDPSGLAIDNDGNMFVIDANTNGNNIAELISIDFDTGEILARREIGQLGGSTLGADFNPLTNELFVASDTGDFFQINTDTGTPTLVGSFGEFRRTSGLAFRPVPEPLFYPSWALAGVVLLRVRTGTGRNRFEGASCTKSPR